MQLSEAQIRALSHLAQYPDEWRSDTPVRQKTLNVLKEKGLVKVTFEPDEGGWLEQITPEGIEAIKDKKIKSPSTWKAYGKTEVRYIVRRGGWETKVAGKILPQVLPTEADAVALGYQQAVWGLRGDEWIGEMSVKYGMIDPYLPVLVEDDERGAVVSYGQSSYGYDIRVDSEFKLFHNLTGGVIDPKKATPDSFVTLTSDDYIEIPANSFVLGKSVEYIRMLPNALSILLGKSTYARCGLVLNFTPLEPDWEGFITIEISNTMPIPVRVYVREGIAQALFFQSPDDCKVTYRTRGGKYNEAQDMQLAIV